MLFMKIILKIAILSYMTDHVAKKVKENINKNEKHSFTHFLFTVLRAYTEV